MSQLLRTRDPDVEDEERSQYTSGGQTLEDLDEKYPNRPRNHSRTFFFSELYIHLFDPLKDNLKRPSGPASHRAKQKAKASPEAVRREIIGKFIARWRSEVGLDFYPALRLIVPNQDRDRGIYGLKENTIGKLLVKITKIDKNSEDGHNLLHWKLPGQQAMAGDFGGRCYDVLSKRPMRIEPGDMRIGEVNEMLSKLAVASGEAEQIPIFETLYRRMNAEELMWFIRIILKEMKVGATGKTFLNMWHQDADSLYSVCSSLRRVCWELYDPSLRLEDNEADVALMQCFQPQLSAYQNNWGFQKMFAKITESNASPEYWIEEKLDGERMQLHMIEDESIPGGRRFGYWSRRGKEYSYLYGEGLFNEKSGLTRHLRDAFVPTVRNIILDGEMITWDMEMDRIMSFGTLKTAALQEQNNYLSENGPRPLFRVFDILYLNDTPLTRYPLKTRREALEKSVKGEHRRLEIHPYKESTSVDDIETELKVVVAEYAEGLVLKNPHSVYGLNQRNLDWMKVKPDYMQDFGESIDVLVIGGYWGAGKRGGKIASFLGGLRASPNDIAAGTDPEKCFSLLRVGGGLSAADFAEIYHLTDGKWNTWNPKKPPSKYIELGGGVEKQLERPDVWIRPSESVIISVKAASINESQQFAKGISMRFPRFKGLRKDRSWDSAMNFDELKEFRRKAEEESKERYMGIEGKRRAVKRRRKELVIIGQDAAPVEFDAPTSTSKLFDGLEFCVLTDCAQPKMGKAQIESLIKKNGGKISQRAIPSSDMLLIGEKNVVKVASLIKASNGNVEIIRARWLLDCAKQRGGFLLPFEPIHFFQASNPQRRLAEDNVDEFGDSYARDVDVGELSKLLKTGVTGHDFMDQPFDKQLFLDQLEEHGDDLSSLKGNLFRKCVMYLWTGEGISAVSTLRLWYFVSFADGSITRDMDDASITHIIVAGQDDVRERELAIEARSKISARPCLPYVVPMSWVEGCWREGTLLAEERYAPV